MAGPNNRAFATSSTEIGLGLETTIGTPPASPRFMIPVKAPKYKPNLTYIPDETLQGSMVQIYDEIQGLRYDGHGWNAPPYMDSFPMLVRGELGSPDTLIAAPTNTTLSSAAVAGATTVLTAASVAQGKYIAIGSVPPGGPGIEGHLVTNVAGTTAPFTLTLNTPLVFNQASGATVTGLTGHQFSLLNNAAAGGDQPPSMSIWDFDGEEWRILTAGQMDELTIKGNATGLVDYTVSWFCNPALNNQSAPVTSFTGTTTPAPWTFAALLGGTLQPTVLEWEFDFKRGTKPIPALIGGTGYLEYFAGPIQASGKMTVVEQSTSPQLNEYLNGTRQSFDFTVFDIVSGNLLNMHCSKAIFKTGEIDRSKEWVEVPLEFQCLPTSTDATAGGVSPILMTVANNVATTY